MKKDYIKGIIRKFREEFGIHFSKSELQFAEAFLEEEIKRAKEEAIENYKKELKEWAKKNKIRQDWDDAITGKYEETDYCIDYEDLLNKLNQPK